MARPTFFTIFAISSFILGFSAVAMASYSAVLWAADPWTQMALFLIGLTGAVALATGLGLWRQAPWTHKSLIALFGLLAGVSWIVQALVGTALVYCVLSVAAILLFGMLATWHVYLRTNVAA